MTELPPELSRLGDQLTAAAERRVSVRRRRAERARRVAATGAAAAVALAILFPAALGPADGDPFRLAAASGAFTYVPNACDQPRGATFAAARPCATPGVTDVATLDRRYAVN